MTYLIHFTKKFKDVPFGPDEMANTAVLLVDVERQEVLDLLKCTFKDHPSIKGALIYKRVVISDHDNENNLYGFQLSRYADNLHYDGTICTISATTETASEFITGKKKNESL